MDADKIKIDIEDRISMIDDSIIKYFWNRPFKVKLLDHNLDSLSKTLKVTAWFLYFHVVLVTVGLILSIVLSLIDFFNVNKNAIVSINKMWLLNIFFFTFVFNVFRYYNLKVKLEKKIYLIKLLDKVDGN